TQTDYNYQRTSGNLTYVSLDTTTQNSMQAGGSLGCNMNNNQDIESLSGTVNYNGAVTSTNTRGMSVGSSNYWDGSFANGSYALTSVLYDQTALGTTTTSSQQSSSWTGDASGGFTQTMSSWLGYSPGDGSFGTVQANSTMVGVVTVHRDQTQSS